VVAHRGGWRRVGRVAWQCVGRASWRSRSRRCGGGAAVTRRGGSTAVRGSRRCGSRASRRSRRCGVAVAGRGGRALRRSRVAVGARRGGAAVARRGGAAVARRRASRRCLLRVATWPVASMFVAEPELIVGSGCALKDSEVWLPHRFRPRLRSRQCRLGCDRELTIGSAVCQITQNLDCLGNPNLLDDL
jgi:hypothetical protein